MKITEKISKIILNNWLLKMLALALAILVYGLVRNKTSFERSFEVDVEVKLEKGSAILEQNPRSATVILRGSEKDINQMDHKKLKIIKRAKMSGATGSESMSLTPKDVEMDMFSGVRVLDVRPRSIALLYDREITKEISIITPKITGSPLVGKVEIEYQPKTATITGSASKLGDRNFLNTEAVDVDGRVESFSKKIKILSPGGSLDTKIHPSEVEVHVNIVTETSERAWSNLTVQAMTGADLQWALELDPPIVTVSIFGRKDLVDRIASNSVVPFVDCTLIKKASTTTLPVNVHTLSMSDLNFRVIPEKVKVRAIPIETAESGKKETTTEKVLEDK